MDIEILAFASILARNIYRYKTKVKADRKPKIKRRVYKNSKILLDAIKANYDYIIPEDYWDYYYLHRFFVDIKSGKANNVQEAVALYVKEERDFLDSLD